jgi:plasmid replication initiation protein
MSNQKLMVCKSNKVIEAGYKLNLNEQRLILLCISKVNSTKPLLASERFEVTAKEFAEKFKINEDKAYQTLKETAEQLFERYVIIDNPDPDMPTLKQTKTRWISSIDYIPDMGKVSVYFAQRMLPYLSQLKGNFTFYILENISDMNSIYAIRLYELLMQWKTTGKREIEIDWLKKQFELDASYERMDNLKRRIIEPAVKDINTHSNYQVSWEQRKTGRKVTHLTFTFTEKQPLTPEKPKRAVKPKEKMILGVAVSEIEKLARAGESYEQAAARINKAKEADKTITKNPKKSNTVKS